MNGKIIKLTGGNYYVKALDTVYKCRARGNFRYEGISPLVGDNVIIELTNENEGYILSVEERKNSLIRPAIANVDNGIIVMSIEEPKYSTYLIDKMIVALKSHEVNPILIFTKADLVEDLTHIHELAKYYKSIGISSAVISNNSPHLEIIKLFENQTSILIGQSGAGKSSMLNMLSTDLDLEVNAISKALGRGKHTTRHTELFELQQNTYVIDAPGFSSYEFENTSVEEVKYYFDDFVELSDLCKFNTCMHINEPKCNVKAHLDNQFLNERYTNYLKFIEEISNQKRKW